MLDEVLDEVRTNGLCYCEAELYRLRGMLLQAVGESGEAEVCLHQALDVARRQQAKSWELRAATSLARFWQQQGKCAEGPRRCSRRSTAGSLRVLTPPTSRRPRRSWRS